MASACGIEDKESDVTGELEMSLEMSVTSSETTPRKIRRLIKRDVIHPSNVLVHYFLLLKVHLTDVFLFFFQDSGPHFRGVKLLLFSQIVNFFSPLILYAYLVVFPQL